MNPFGTKSLEYQGGTDPNNSNYVKLSSALQEADTERRKSKEAAEQRERAAEMRREERQKKIDYMTNMPDSTPAGTGKSIVDGYLQYCSSVTIVRGLSTRSDISFLHM